MDTNVVANFIGGAGGGTAGTGGTVTYTAAEMQAALNAVRATSAAYDAVVTEGEANNWYVNDYGSVQEEYKARRNAAAEAYFNALVTYYTMGGSGPTGDIYSVIPGYPF
jgi:hypothetical protein